MTAVSLSRFSVQSGQSAKSYKRLLSASALTAVSFLCLYAPANAQNAWSQFDDQAGSITIDTPNVNETNINQITDRYVGNSDNLDINTGQTVTIGQNNTTSMFVARSTRAGSDPTKILGTLNTRLKDTNGNFTDSTGGQVMVLDRNGVLFGEESRLDVGGIIASTGTITNTDLTNDDDRFEFSDFGDGKIENRGQISVKNAGLAAFVSPEIVNSGTIEAEMGTVAMGSGDRVTLDFNGDKLMEISVAGETSRALIENTGMMNVDGGRIMIEARAASDIVNNVINMDGIVSANTARMENGEIVLGNIDIDGGDNGITRVSGTMQANGDVDSAGTISINGSRVRTDGTSQIEAKSQGAAGGRINVTVKRANINGSMDVSSATNENGGTIDIDASTRATLNGDLKTSKDGLVNVKQMAV